MSFTGGKLKLKGGGADLSTKGGTKKKKKRANGAADGAGTALSALVADKGAPAGIAPDAAPSVAQEPGSSGAAVPAPPADRRTDAERRHDAHVAKLEAERAKKAALKSHRERIKELNEKLSTMSEHNDIPRISYSYM